METIKQFPSGVSEKKNKRVFYIRINVRIPISPFSGADRQQEILTQKIWPSSAIQIIGLLYNGREKLCIFKLFQRLYLVGVLYNSV